MLKEAMTKAPVLAIPDDNKAYTLFTDSSGLACGAVLLQDDGPVAFWSYRMNPPETRYQWESKSC